VKRRQGVVMGVMACVLGSALCGTAQVPEKNGINRITIEVQEKAGIRRNNYPVHATFTLENPLRNLTEQRRFRLLDKDKVVPAYFNTVDGIDRKSMRVSFHSSHAPFESRTYTVEYGPGVEIQPPFDLKKGLRIEEAQELYEVKHPGGLALVVPFRMQRLLKRVGTKKTEYLRPDSAGLFFRLKQPDQPPILVGGPQYNEETRLAFPLIAFLEANGFQDIGGDRVRTDIHLEFPLSRSWVRVDFSVDDPKGLVKVLGVDLNLNIHGEPTLVDFGAGTSVYTTLKKGQSAVLRSGPVVNDRPGWQVLVGPTKAPTPFVVMPPGQPSKAEGWAHVMDRERCTAVAVAYFAQDRQHSEIAVDADGRLRCEREFDGKTARKTLTFWLHFVSMPVQQGAATSPQSMMNPLHVEVRKR
jgi:hypothetical protein